MAHLLKRVTGIALLLGSLSLAIGCDSQSPLRPTDGFDPYLLLEGASGVSLGNIDTSHVSGLVMSAVSQLEDTVFTDGATVTDFDNLWAVFKEVDDSGADAAQWVKANDVTLKDPQGTHVFSYSISTTSLSGGSNVAWDAKLSDNTTFVDTIESPSPPVITNIDSYDTISISNAVSITTSNSVTDGEAIVQLALAPFRTTYFVDSSVAAHTIKDLSIQNTQWDDGSLVISASEMSNLQVDGIYLLSVFRFRYDVGEDSSNRPIGMFAMAEYSIPVYVTE